MNKNFLLTGNTFIVTVIAALLLGLAPMFLFMLPGQVPVVLYHAHHDGGFSFSEPMFREHMEFLRDNDYTPITLDELLDWREYDAPLPLRPIVLTFDDNYTGMKTIVAPIMREMDFVGINFAHTNYVGWIPPGDVQRPTWDDLVQWEQEGILITESHTIMHYNLTSLSDEDVIEELEGSKAAIESNMPDKECLYLAYPYGAYNQFVITRMELAGYRAGFTTESKPATRQDNLMEIPRIGVDGTTLATFQNQIRFHNLPPDPPGEGWTLNTNCANFIFQPEGWDRVTGSAQSFGSHVYSAQAPVNPAGWNILLSGGNYRLHAWWPESNDHATNTPFIIEDTSGITTIHADQTTGGGEWNLLGNFHFSADEPARIHLGTEADGIMIADGIWIEPVPETYVDDWYLF